jgi:hypothetical protein
MKRLIFTLIASAAFFTMNLSNANAQEYRNALGLGVDFGNGATLVGPSFKHFFNANGAGQVEVLFGGNSTRLQAFYQYHGGINGAPGLKWFVGGGPGLNFLSVGNYDRTNFLLIPQLGLDFKFPGAPIQAGFDWRPTARIGDNSDFEAGRFGFGFRFTF